MALALETKMTREPPPNEPPCVTGFDGDNIEDIGERIASLTPKGATDLVAYLGEILG